MSKSLDEIEALLAKATIGESLQSDVKAGRVQEIVNAKRELLEAVPSLIAAARERDRLREALDTAEAALMNYACHVGPSQPCIRTKHQCYSECGKSAGDALLVIDTARTALEARHDAR